MTTIAPAVGPKRRTLAAPFLVWPVSRREFYRSIWLAMIPTFAWAAVIFGERVAAMLVFSVLAVTISHVVTKRILPWERGKLLVYSHSLVTALVVVGLSHPLWPVWIVTLMAFLVPLVLALIGGPGKEKIHVALVAVLLIQWGIMPFLAGTTTYSGGPAATDGPAPASATQARDIFGGDAILVRNRLFMGDVREQQSTPFFRWPISSEIGGNDALRMELPARVAAGILDDASRLLQAHGAESIATFSDAESRTFARRLDEAFALRLPDIGSFLLGATPGRIGTVSLIAIIGAGLYLAYRYILRPRSVVLFIATFVAGSLLFAFWPTAVGQVGPVGLWNLHKTFPGAIELIIVYLVLNSDIAFAAIFILALPGTEPLTPRGRRVLLLLSGISAAYVHRVYPGLPAASLALSAFMPLAPLFDRLFGKRSWLNAKQTRPVMRDAT